MEMIRDKEVITRKKYFCYWCGEIIPLGSKAKSQVWKYEGVLNSGHLHLECDAAWKTVKPDDVPVDGFEEYCQVRGSTSTLDSLSRTGIRLETAWREFLNEIGQLKAIEWLFNKLSFFGDTEEEEES